jgi:diguanylate cyclase (GGDEF)-like protein/PAS domain S-box-containing protein
MSIDHKKLAVQTEQIEALFATHTLSLISGVLLAAVLCYIQWDVIDHGVILGWFVTIGLVQLARIFIVLMYQRNPSNISKVTTERLFKFRLGVLISALIWGSAAILLYPTDQPQHQIFLIFILAGLSTASVVSYSADLVSGLLFSASITIPLIARLFSADNTMSLAMATAALLYFFFLIGSLRQINRNLIENIRMRLDANSREEAMKISEERYRLLLTNSPVGIFHYDTNLVITYCNERFAKILNNDAAHVIGLDMNHLKDPSILPALRAAIKGEQGYFEGYYRATFSDADGWVSMTTASSLDAQGNVVGGIAIVEDISNRKLAESELRIAATAFEAQEGMLITDADNLIIRVNRTFTSITGYLADEVVGKNPRFLASGKQDAEFYSSMWKNLCEKGTWEGEIWNRRKNGDIFPEHLQITVVKDVDGRVTNYVAAFNDITTSKAAANEIENLAFYDPLTQLPNRRLLTDRLMHCLASSARSGNIGALLFIDLDNFKTLNDTLGHDIGDLLLKQVAARLNDCVREDDTVARLGGDEFVVILENLGLHPLDAAAKAEAVGEKILSALNRTYQIELIEYHSSASVGVTLLKGHELSIDELMKQADIAMYQAKKAGRNALRFFDLSTQLSINARATLERDLRKALEKKQFSLHYQIQLDRAGKALCAEVLIRWFHPERGFVSPAEFIPLAEETGLILPIGQWVLETACSQLHAWQGNILMRDLVLAVNVSAKQFHQDDFANQVRDVIQRHSINPMLLKLELTESALVENIEEIIIKMNELREMNIQFSLDDFGTGYSSLQYLKRLPLNQLKIDQSFVRELTSSSSDRAIVRTIIAMAQSLNLEVIAEGVETEEQRQLLDDIGCDNYQGYLFSRPVAIEQFESLLQPKNFTFLH